MMFLIDGTQPIEGQMRINLRGRDIGVPENRLDGSQVCTVLDHVRSARVPQHVRRRVASGSGRRRSDHLPDALARELFPSASDKEQWRVSCLHIFGLNGWRWVLRWLDSSDRKS